MQWCRQVRRRLAAISPLALPPAVLMLRAPAASRPPDGPVAATQGSQRGEAQRVANVT